MSKIQHRGNTVIALLLGVMVGYMFIAFLYDKSEDFQRFIDNDSSPKSPVICKGTLQEKAKQAATRHSIPQSLYVALITAESAWNPNAVSSKGAIGLGQIMPSTGKQFCGLKKDELFDSCKNLDCSSKYLAHLHGKTRNWTQAVQSYNAGYKRIMVDKVIPEETAQYVKNIRKFGGNI